MKVGDLIRSIHDHAHRGIGVGKTRIASGRVIRVQWFNGEQTVEYARILEVISEGG